MTHLSPSPRGRALARGAAAVFACATFALVAGAHVRLIHPSNGKALKWGRPETVNIVFNATGSDDVDDATHISALRNALAAWNDAGGTEIHVTEITTPSQMARTDWAADNIHLVIFDEDDSSGYFPPGSGTVAITPVWFFESGAITDADILFNGSGFSFTTSGEFGRFDVQDVAAHELGHFFGLDHSGWAGSTMYPYVDPSVILHRSVSADEVHALRQAYPDGVFASLTGVVKHASDDSVIAGAHVVARDAAGRTCASALSSSIGAFTIGGLDAGTYTLYATPLEGPVTVANLGSGHSVETDFESTVLGTWAVTEGQELNVGQLFAETDVAIGLGRNSDDYPLRAIQGQTRSFIVRGAGLTAGSTLAASDPALTLSNVSWFNTQVSFQVATPAGAALGHVDLVVTNAAGERSILPAALEITPRDPAPTSVAPTQGNSTGGTLVTISGSRFRAGSRVVIGSDTYVDGALHGCTVVDAGTITLTTHRTVAGTYDVTVIDPSGVEGRVASAFEFASIPVVNAIFPAAGSAAGGTLVRLTGAQFDAGCSVTIDGVVQTNVVRVSASELEITTQAYVPGGPYVVEVTNPLGATAQAAFSFAAGADPSISALDPASGSASGGEEITVHGANFTASTEVVFGADVETGVGGAVATVAFVDANTLLVTTPRIASGAQSVLVRESSTGQAVLQAAAFTFMSSGGGGGGGCSIAPAGGDGPGSSRETAAALAWFAGLLGVLYLRARAFTRRARG